MHSGKQMLCWKDLCKPDFQENRMVPAPWGSGAPRWLQHPAGGCILGNRMPVESGLVCPPASSSVTHCSLCSSAATLADECGVHGNSKESRIGSCSWCLQRRKFRPVASSCQQGMASSAPASYLATSLPCCGSQTANPTRTSSRVLCGAHGLLGPKGLHCPQKMPIRDAPFSFLEIFFFLKDVEGMTNFPSVSSFPKCL